MQLVMKRGIQMLNEKQLSFVCFESSKNRFTSERTGVRRQIYAFPNSSPPTPTGRVIRNFSG